MQPSTKQVQRQNTERKLQRLASLSAAAKALMSGQATGQADELSPRKEYGQDGPAPWQESNHTAQYSRKNNDTSPGPSPRSADSIGPVWWTSNSSSLRASPQPANLSVGSAPSSRESKAVVKLHRTDNRMGLTTGLHQRELAGTHPTDNTVKGMSAAAQCSTVQAYSGVSSGVHSRNELGGSHDKHNSPERDELVLLAMQQIQLLQQQVLAKKAAQSTAGVLAPSMSGKQRDASSTFQEAWTAIPDQGEATAAYLQSSLYASTAPRQAATACSAGPQHASAQQLTLLSPAASATFDVGSISNKQAAVPTAVSSTASEKRTVSTLASINHDTANGQSADKSQGSSSRGDSVQGSLSLRSSPILDQRLGTPQASSGAVNYRSSNSAPPAIKAGPPPPLDLSCIHDPACEDSLDGGTTVPLVGSTDDSRCAAQHTTEQVPNTHTQSRLAMHACGSINEHDGLADVQQAGTSCESICEPHSLEDSQTFEGDHPDGSGLSTAAAATAAAPQAAGDAVGDHLQPPRTAVLPAIGRPSAGEKDSSSVNGKLAAVTIAAKAALASSASRATSGAGGAKTAVQSNNTSSQELWMLADNSVQNQLQGQQHYSVPAASRRTTYADRRLPSTTCDQDQQHAGGSRYQESAGRSTAQTASHYPYSMQAAEPSGTAAAKIAAMQTAIAAVDQAMQERTKSLAAVATLLANPEQDRRQAGGSAAHVDTLQDLVQQLKQLEQTKQKLQLSIGRLEQGHASSFGGGVSSSTVGRGLTESLSTALRALQDQIPQSNNNTALLQRTRTKSKITMDHSPFEGQDAAGAVSGRSSLKATSSRTLDASHSPDEVLVSGSNHSYYGGSLLRRRRSFGPDSGVDAPEGAVIEGYANIWSAQRSQMTSSVGRTEIAGHKHNSSGSTDASLPPPARHQTPQSGTGKSPPLRQSGPYRAMTASPGGVEAQQARRHSSDDGQHHKTAAAASTRSVLLSKAASSIRGRFPGSACSAGTVTAATATRTGSRQKQQKLVMSHQGTSKHHQQHAGGKPPDKSPITGGSPSMGALRAQKTTGPLPTAQHSKPGAAADRSAGTHHTARQWSSPQQQHTAARSVSQKQLLQPQKQQQQAVEHAVSSACPGSVYPSEGFFLSREHSSTAAGMPGWASPRTSSSESKMLQLMQVLADFQAGEIPEQDLRASLELVLMSRDDQRQQQQQQQLQPQGGGTTMDGWQAWQRQQQQVASGGGFSSRQSSRPPSRPSSRPSSMFGRQLSRMLLMVQDLSSGGA